MRAGVTDLPLGEPARFNPSQLELLCDHLGEHVDKRWIKRITPVLGQGYEAHISILFTFDDSQMCKAYRLVITLYNGVPTTEIFALSDDSTYYHKEFYDWELQKDDCSPCVIWKTPEEAARFFWDDLVAVATNKFHLKDAFVTEV